jgi:hypothetical protein
MALLLPVAFKLGWSERAQDKMNVLVPGHLVEKASELLFDSSIISNTQFCLLALLKSQDFSKSMIQGSATAG